MDTMPPQAPPALTQSAYQEASDAFDRLVALQAWLATEDARIPALPDTLAAGALPAYLDALSAYWNAPPGDAAEGTSRRAMLAAHLATAARDLAVIGQHDGALDDDALALVRDLVATGAGNLPAHLSVHEPMFGSTVYSGVLLVQDQRTSGRILLFSAQDGWTAFSSLADALARIEQHARRALVMTRDLPGIARQHLTSLGSDSFVTSRPIAGQPFDTLVDGLIQTQRDKLEQAAFEFALAPHDSPTRQTTFTDTAFAAVRLDSAVDVAHLLSVRHAAMMEAFNDQRLTRVPANVAKDWLDAEAIHRATLPAVLARGQRRMGRSAFADRLHHDGPRRKTACPRGYSQSGRYPGPGRPRLRPCRLPGIAKGPLRRTGAGRHPPHRSRVSEHRGLGPGTPERPHG